MNDEDVQNDMRAPPFDHKNAYMLFYMKDKETSLAETLAQLAKTPTSSTSNASPTSNLPTRPPKRKIDRVIDSDPEDEDIGESVSSAAGQPPSLVSIVNSVLSSGPNPSPSKKPRLGDGRTPLGVLKANVTNGIVFTGKTHGVNGVNGSSTISSVASPAPVRSMPKVMTKTLDLPGAASDSESDDEDEDKTKDKDNKSTQNQQNNLGKTASLPSPVSPVKAGPKAWQLDDPESEATPKQAPTSTADSEPEKTEAEPPSSSTVAEATTTQSSDLSSQSLGLKERDGGMRAKNPNKVYQSKSKKEQRGTNPYGMLGLGTSSGGSRVRGTGYVLGNKKIRRAGI